MDITCYLPDELGKLAKDANLPLSRILRAGVEAALNIESAPVKPTSTKARLDALEFRMVQLDAINARLDELEQTVSPTLDCGCRGSDHTGCTYNDDEDDSISPAYGPMDAPA